MQLTNDLLHTAGRTADFLDIASNHSQCRHMLRFMLAQHAIGLAANQIGSDLRLFVMQVNGVTRFCFNPEIVDSKIELTTMAEACLSFVGDQCTLQRADHIEVRYQDHRGCWIQESLTGLTSRCYQHELDHVNGITMWHRQKEQHAEQSGN